MYCFVADNVIDPNTSILLWPCYRMVIMLALITIASCRILAYYPHYEPLWVINCYLHVCCRPLGDTNNNIDSTSSIVYAPKPRQTLGFWLYSFIYKEISIYLCTIQPTSNNALPCYNLLHVFFHHEHNFWVRLFQYNFTVCCCFNFNI